MAAALSREARLEIRLALEELNAAFAYHLDHGEIAPLVDLFTDDAVYTHGTRRSVGRAAIDDLFHRRAEHGPRTARHIYSGLRITIESPSRASGTSVCLSFAADGLPPLPAVPFLVADFNDVYALCDDGRWRFAARHIERIFVGDDNPGPIAADDR